MPDQECSECGHFVPINHRCCPHCARPGLFPNVVMARQEDEVAALGIRYDDALATAVANGVGRVFAAFEAACKASRAVISRSSNDVFRLATSDRELYATFYQLQNLRLPRQVPAGPQWDVIRAVADTALFGDDNKREVRFCALSLDEAGLPYYGDCTLVLREDMIAHRASAFERNSLLFMRDHGVKIWDSADLPKGFRSTWPDRGRLCAAKLAGELAVEMNPADFAGILLKEGQTSLDDDFVEVHVFGPMTIRTFEHMVVDGHGPHADSAQLDALRT